MALGLTPRTSGEGGGREGGKEDGIRSTHACEKETAVKVVRMTTLYNNNTLNTPIP